MASLLNMSGGGLLNKVLPYDTEIEYLKSSGTQYIDTGLKLYEGGNANFEIELQVFTYSSQTDINACVFGSMYEAEPYPGMTIRCNGAYVQLRQIVDVDVTVNLGRVNSLVTVNETIQQNASHNTKATLFAQYKPDESPFRFCKMRLYYCKIKNKGVLVRDYIPVRAGSVGYLYDKVSGQLLGNSGTGDFILGPDV